MKIGIIAYGSLIDDPGCEIKKLIKGEPREITTPFHVEFAHLSQKRHGAPTLVPVKKDGSPVKAKLFVMKDGTERKDAEDILFRREIHDVGGKSKYNSEPPNKKKKIYIRSKDNWEGMDHCLYTCILPEKFDPDQLADNAIKSAEFNNCQDGISYLINTIKNGIVTPLTEEYKNKILDKKNSSTLEEARQKCWMNKSKGS